MKPRLTLTESAQKSVDEVLAKYGDDQQRLSVLAGVEAITAVAVHLCRDELNRARDAFNRYDWRTALAQYGEVKRSAEQLLSRGTNTEDARSVIVSATLGEVSCLLNLQELEGAERSLASVPTVGLDLVQRAVFARSLVALEHAHRAREVLDQAPYDERTHAKWLEASQLVELALGNVPEVVERSPSVLHRLSHHHLVSGDVEKAAAIALEALEEPSVNPVLGSALLSTAMVALMRTVYEDDIKGDGVPVLRRAEYAQTISIRFRSLFTTQLPSMVRRNLLGLGLNYSGSLREHDLLRWILSNSEDLERDQAETNELKVAFELAAAGDVAKAIAVLPKQRHPWREDLIRFRLLREAGQLNAAVDGLIGLATAWPGRVPVHAALAEMLIEQRDFALALPHAEACHRGLPTDSMASLLARCLVELGDGHRALSALANAVTTDHVLELRAYGADLAHDPRAPRFWSQLLERASAEPNVKLRLGVSLARTGDVEGAARHARELLENHLASLKRDDVATCGQLLSLARFLPNSDALIKLAAETLRTRFPDDVVAEFQRLLLVSGLGFPEGVAPIDYDRLARAGHLQALSLDDAADVVRRKTELSQAAHALYHAGCLSIDTLCEVTGTRLASMLESWSDAAGKGTNPLRAAIIPGPAPAGDPLVAGQTYFCSGLELLLLQHSGALPHVKAAIGDGALVSLESTWSSLINDAFYLEQTAQRDEALRIGTLLRKLATWTNVRRLDEGPADERATAGKFQCAFVAIEPTELDDTDALSLLFTIAENALVSRAQLAEAARILGRPLARPSTRVDLQKPLLFQSGLFELFDTAGVLGAVIAACARVHVTGGAVAVLQNRLDGLERQGRAATLQKRCVEELGIGLRAGWFRLIQEPQTSSLPPLREDADPNQAELLTRSIRRLVAVKQLVAEHSGWHRVVADSFGFDTLGHPQQWKMLAFKNNVEGREFVRRYWTPSKNEITLGRFARSVVQSAQRPSTIRQLARLGFSDALLPQDIIEMEDEFGRLDTGAAGRVLDGVEASVGDSHARGVFCRTQVASVYAMTMWQFAMRHPQQTASCVSACHQLLDRLEQLDERHATRLVEQAVCNLAVAALDDRKSSFVEGPDGTYLLVPESVAGQFWRAIYTWEACSARRKSSFRRGLGHAWELLGNLKNGPDGAAQWAPLALANDILVDDRASEIAVPSPDGVVAILSALWKERPLRLKRLALGSDKEEVEVDLEELLAVAARNAPADGSDAWRSDGSSLSFPYVPKVGAAPITLSMPVEAVLLRMEASEGAKAARQLAKAVGFRDGRLYNALLEFAKQPNHAGVRKDLALAACGAPFRLVADDPKFVLSFGDRAATSQHGYPASLAELREMLSEPDQLFTGPLAGQLEHELPAEFTRRLEGGIWAHRSDSYALVHFASRVPGRLPSTAARSMFNAETDEDLEAASKGLESSQDLTVGSLAMAVGFAILTCSSERAAVLKERMGSALAEALRREALPQQSASLAAVESSVLRGIGHVVSRFSPWGIAEVEHAWLTTRLYEWWVREVDSSEVVSMFAAEPAEEWSPLRLEVILNVVLDVLEGLVTSEQRLPTMPPLLIDALKWVVTAYADSPFEPAHRLPWLYWARPQGCGWLAASILLWIDPRTFFEMRPEMRLALLEKLPRTTSAAKANGLSYLPVVRALGRGARELKEPELEAIHTWIATAESDGLLDLWRAELLTGLLASTGDRSVASELRSLAMRETLQTSRAELLGSYIDAIANVRSPDLYPSVIELIETFFTLEQGDVVARGLRLALERQNSDVARDLLQELVSSPTATPQVASAIATALREITSST
jgi:hypothetical protein